MGFSYHVLPFEVHFQGDLSELSRSPPMCRERHHFSRWQSVLQTTVSSAHLVPKMTNEKVNFPVD